MRICKVRCLEYALLAVGLSVLCYLFPYTGDDWAWGSSIGIKRLTSWFDNYSGRYVGNLIVLVLTRYKIVFVVSFVACFLSIVHSLGKLFSKSETFYFVVVLLLLIPSDMFRQVYPWAAGFANYVTSITFILIYISYAIRVFDDNKYSSFMKNDIVVCLPLLILGAVNSLIVEHITIYNVFLGMMIIIYTIFKYQKILVQHLFYAMGALGGAYYMFSNSVYHSISNGDDGYRSVANGGIIERAIINYKDAIYSGIVMNNVFLLMMIFVVIFLVVRRTNTKRLKRVIDCLVIYIGVFTAYALFSRYFFGSMTKSHSCIIAECAMTGGYIICLIIVLITIGCWYDRLNRVLFWVISMCIISGPLLFVNPIGPRCFYASYIVLVCMFCEVYSIVNEMYNMDVVLDVRRMAYCAGIALFVFYFGVYLTIHEHDIERLELIREAANQKQKEVVVHKLPYNDYVWCGEPEENTIWQERYKLFYNIDNDIIIKVF